MAEAVLSDAICQRVLKVTAKQLVSAYQNFISGSLAAGMIGFNINVANVVAASGPIRARRFYVAATLGEFLYVVGAIFLGLGGAALARRSLPIALALAGLALVAALFVWQARARRRARATVGAEGTPSEIILKRPGACPSGTGSE
jgi:uncharacterized membrane protein YdjX (TVP38/TMEM64 family)